MGWVAAREEAVWEGVEAAWGWPGWVIGGGTDSLSKT